MFAEFINEYGAQLLYAIITAIAGYVGIVVKNIYQRYVNDQTKREVVKIAVRGVEQVFSTLGGEEKLKKAIEAAGEMLNEKGIAITEFELRMLIEAAVNEFNNAFKKTAAIEGGDVK